MISRPLEIYFASPRAIETQHVSGVVSCLYTSLYVSRHFSRQTTFCFSLSQVITAVCSFPEFLKWHCFNIYSAQEVNAPTKRSVTQFKHGMHHWLSGPFQVYSPLWQRVAYDSDDIIFDFLLIVKISDKEMPCLLVESQSEKFIFFLFLSFYCVIVAPVPFIPWSARMSHFDISRMIVYCLSTVLSLHHYH